MATKIESRILNVLLDSYEKSKTFIGENKNQQTFKISVARLFPKYDDDSDFAFYKEINTNLESLKTKELVQPMKSLMPASVVANVDSCRWQTSSKR